MKNDSMELVFILDRSGSMHGLENDTIGGFNSMIEKQKSEIGEVLVTTVLFDNQVEMLHNRIDICALKPMTRKEYFVRGTTALLDAIGSTITHISNNHMQMDRTYCPEKTLFVIITDGYENASREYSKSLVKEMIEREQKENNWEFLFLGANIDSVATASGFGIDADHSVDFHADEKGLQVNYDVLSEAICMKRAAAPSARLNKSWKKRVEDDYKSR